MASLRRYSSGLRLDGRAVVFALFALWLLIIVNNAFGLSRLPLPGSVIITFLYGFPVVGVCAGLLSRSPTPSLPVVAGMACAVLGSLMFMPAVGALPALALAVPAVVVGALLTQKFPTTSLVLMFVLASAYGSIEAFTGLPPGQVVDFVLGGLWVGALGRVILGAPRRELRMTPGSILLIAFLALTLVSIPFGDALGASLKAFRLSAWHLSVLLLVAYGPFDEPTLERLRKWMTFIILAASVYATVRWVIGEPDAREAALVDELGRQYNKIAGSGDEKLIGALPDGSELGLWTACTIPFLVAMAVSARGLVRLTAFVALPLSLITLFGSNQRNAAAAAAAGGAVIVVIHLLSRGFRGPRLGVALAAVVAAIISGVAVYPRVIETPEQRQRYENLLRPSEDPSFQERVQKWRQVLDDLRGEPFGFGLGTGNTGAIQQRVIRLGANEIDNSYLKIAYEQGLFVMVFFIVMLLVLLVELLRHAVWTRAPGPAGLTAAACGTLVSMMIDFVGGIQIDSLASLTGWMIVGLGVAQYTADRSQPDQRLPAP